MSCLNFLVAAFLTAAAAIAPPAAQAQPKSGTDYSELKAIQPVEAKGKVEVAEFFWYRCPHCYSLEPKLEAWVKKLPADVHFVRIPAVLSDNWAIDAGFFYTFEALGVLDKVHRAFFDSIHKDRLVITSEPAVTEWLKNHGIDRKKFDDTYKSFGVQAKVKRAAQLSSAYQLEGVPLLAIQGKYTVSAEQGGSQDGMLATTSSLIDIVRKGTGKKIVRDRVRVFITGASSGIGESLARHYASEDSSIGLAARRKDLLESLAKGLPGNAATYALDVTDSAALESAAADFIARFGVPDIVIANAGISIGTSGEDIADAAKLKRVLDVNVVGMAATLSAFAPAMKKAGAGTLAGISSVAGFRGLPGSGAYSASKSAATTWLESLRVELAGSGVAVVTICPGFIDTPMTKVNRYRMPFLISSDEAARRFARAIESKRRLAVIPWQMAIVGCLLRVLPHWAYDRLMARAPRKSRNLSL